MLFFFQAEDGIRDWSVTGVQTCALPISAAPADGRSCRGLPPGGLPPGGGPPALLLLKALPFQAVQLGKVRDGVESKSLQELPRRPVLDGLSENVFLADLPDKRPAEEELYHAIRG